jgi:subtilisin family serine protease
MKTRILPLLCLIIFYLPGNMANAQGRLSPDLEARVQASESGDLIPVNIILTEQYDTEVLSVQTRKIAERAARRAYVVNELKNFSAARQVHLMDFLEAKALQGQVADIRPLWIGNMIHCKASPEVIAQLATRKDVDRLNYDQQHQLLTAEAGEPLPQPVVAKGAGSPSPAWNVTRINAPLAWQQGYKGENVVVAVLDTGVNYEHLDIRDQMWVHPDFPKHGYNFIENNFETMDFNGHGTHCAGTVAGNGASGLITGIAPHARIMAVKVLSNTGGGTQAGVWAGIQFAVENGAHVLSLSLGWNKNQNPDRGMWRAVMDHTLAAGVVAAVAAGNLGTTWSLEPPFEVATPGDIPPPWTHPDQILTGGNSAVISVGATMESGSLASFSSKGPVSWENEHPYFDYPYNPEMGLIRPDIVAPGAHIYSLSHQNLSGYLTMSGASMATPAVAGIIALMISKDPDLTPENISRILEQSAIPLSETKSNSYGSGLADALGAVSQVPLAGIEYVSHSLGNSTGEGSEALKPGETIRMNLVLENTSDRDISDVILTLNVNSQYITLADTIAPGGFFTAGQQKSLEELFSFDVCPGIPGNQEIEFFLSAHEADCPERKWKSRFQETTIAANLVFSLKIDDDNHLSNNNGMLDPGEFASLNILVSNTGNVESEEIYIELELNAPFIFLENTGFSLPPVAANAQTEVRIPIQADAGMPTGAALPLILDVVSGYQDMQKVFLLKDDSTLEDWQSSDFSKFAWHSGGDAPWIVEFGNAYSGNFAASSGTVIGHNRPTLIVEMEVLTKDSISFHKKVLSQEYYNHLEFFIDDIPVGRWSGAKDWERVSFAVESGLRTFKWVFKPTTMAGNNRAWIDNIRFPALVVPVAFAGWDDILCGEAPYPVSGYASGHTLTTWKTDGDGSFSNNQLLKTTYSPGRKDQQRGYVNLTLEAARGNQVNSSRSIRLNIFPEPLLNLAGESQICSSHPIMLHAGSAFESYLWFDGSTLPWYVADAANLGPEADIWVVATDPNGCVASDTLRVVFGENCDTPFSSINQIALKVFPNPVSSHLTASWHQETPGAAIIRLFTCSGRLVREYPLTNASGWQSHTMPVTGLGQGIYLLQVVSPDGTATQRLIIQ